MVESIAPEVTSFDDLALTRAQIIEKLQALFVGAQNSMPLPMEVTQVLTMAEVTALEAVGVVLSGTNTEHPDGGLYVKDLFRDTLPGLRPQATNPTEPIDSINASGILRGVTGLITRPPSPGIPNNIKGLQKIPVTSLVAAVLKGKDGTWTESTLLPDGSFVVDGFDNASFQYGQGCFEGMVAVDLEVEADQGGVTIFRAEENAMRFIKSCEAINIPPPTVQQFISAVTKAVKANLKFVPESGKLYIRPFAVGLQGGAGANAANNYLFAVEVLPFGEYLAASSGNAEEGTLGGIDVKAIRFNRPASSRHKLSGGYAPTFKMKTEAKKEGYGGVVLIDSKGRIQECATSNIFLLKRTDENTFEITTPGTNSANILPGITRKSLIEILKDPKIQAKLGSEIIITCDEDTIVEESQLDEVTGLFTTGTAVGITNISSLRNLSGNDRSFTDLETQKLIKKISDLLIQLRRGKVEEYEDWALKVA